MLWLSVFNKGECSPSWTPLLFIRDTHRTLNKYSLTVNVSVKATVKVSKESMTCSPLYSTKTPGTVLTYIRHSKNKKKGICQIDININYIGSALVILKWARVSFEVHKRNPVKGWDHQDKSGLYLYIWHLGTKAAESHDGVESRFQTCERAIQRGFQSLHIMPSEVVSGRQSMGAGYDCQGQQEDSAWTLGGNDY